MTRQALICTVLLAIVALLAVRLHQTTKALHGAVETLEAQERTIAQQDADFTALVKRGYWQRQDEFEKRMRLDRIDSMLINGLLARLPDSEQSFQFELKDYEFCHDWAVSVSYEETNRLGNLACFSRNRSWLSRAK